jgi:hypothetical protein
MELQRILQAETCLRRIESRLGSLLEREAAKELQDACFLLAEVRHFAVCWSDSQEMVAQGRLTNAMNLRDDITHRLTQTLQPYIPDPELLEE